jgi:chromosome segregation ATPase
MTIEITATCDKCRNKITSEEHYCVDCLSAAEEERDGFKRERDKLDDEAGSLGATNVELNEEIRLLKEQLGESQDEVKRLERELEHIQSMEPR